MIICDRLRRRAHYIGRAADDPPLGALLHFERVFASLRQLAAMLDDNQGGAHVEVT